MKVNPNSNATFKAGINLENEHLYKYRGWGMDWKFRKELEDLKNSPTNNTYGIRPIVEEKKPAVRPKKNYPPYVKPPVDLLNHI